MCTRRQVMICNTLRLGLVLTTVWALSASVSSVAGQTSGNDVAYVMNLAGRASAVAQGSTAELGDLDIIDAGTRVDLDPDSQLRLCHYRLRRVMTLKGPLHAVISATGIATDQGDAAFSGGEACTAPAVSNIQGGVAYRGLVPVTIVALHPSIKLSDGRAHGVRRAQLWDEQGHAAVASFSGGVVVRPQLADGQDYFLLVEFEDGRQWRLSLRASAAAPTSAVILVLQ